jgi:agmatine/peptidylarginine deiminase
MIRFPAEWEPQSAVLIAWPHNTGDFQNRLESVENTYAVIARTIAQYQKLLIVCRDNHHEQHIKTVLGEQSANTVFLIASLNDIWVRDTVFLTIENAGKPQLLNFRFNGWGNKYPHQEDNALNHKLLYQPPFKNSQHSDIEFVLEGGSVESDGHGTLLTTRQCLLNPNRNPTLSQTEIEELLYHYFGVNRLLWLDQDNLSGDDTDAHIDTLARFCSADTIAYTSCDDTGDQHYSGLQNMAEQLKSFRNNANNPYNLVALPMPQPIYNESGERLPANYANFLIINGAVLLPIYDDPVDKIALAKLTSCFADRKIIPIPCKPLVQQYGSLHCMTMQFPKKVFL